MNGSEAFPWTDALIILALILLNGLFAMSELAIVSARTAKLQNMAASGNKGAQAAIKLAADPGKFLSTVQIGITLIGIINGAYSGASLGQPTGKAIETLGIGAETAESLGFALIIAITTYLSLVVGELVPKQIALRIAEPVAAIMALPMQLMAKVTAPIVWVLDTTSSLILRLFNMGRSSGDRVTAEELQMIFADATRSGVIEENERAIMAGVVRLSDRPVREVMTPRTEVVWLDRNANPDELREALLDNPHSLIPVADGSVDRIEGLVSARDLLVLLAEGARINLEPLVRKAEIVPDQLDAMDALKVLQQADLSMALVHDEYGHFEGLVTPADLLSAMAGDFASHHDEGDDPMLTEREDGSYLVSGAMAADKLADLLDIELDEDRDYATAAGRVLAVLRRLPEEGEVFEDSGWRFEVVDMDGRRIDKLLVSKASANS